MVGSRMRVNFASDIRQWLKGRLLNAIKNQSDGNEGLYEKMSEYAQQIIYAVLTYFRTDDVNARDEWNKTER